MTTIERLTDWERAHDRGIPPAHLYGPKEGFDKREPQTAWQAIRELCRERGYFQPMPLLAIRRAMRTAPLGSSDFGTWTYADHRALWVAERGRLTTLLDRHAAERRVPVDAERAVIDPEYRAERIRALAGEDVG
jgi:hypothetical protein